MIPKRYYLTLISTIFLIATQTFIARSVYLRVRRRPKLLRGWQIGVTVAAILMLITVLSEFGATDQLPRSLILALQTLVNLWSLSSLGAVVIYLLTRCVFDHLPTKFREDRRQALRLIAGAAVAAPSVAVGFGTFVERTNFEVCEREIAIRNLPRDLQGIRILQLSDIHLGAYLSVNTLERVIDCSNQLQSHLAFITGDLISGPHDPLDDCLRQLARLKPAWGSFGCLGNHEIYAGAESYTTTQGKRLGIDFLRGEKRTLRIGEASLNLAGVDYLPFEQRPNYLKESGALVMPGAVNLLMSHNPDVFPAATARGFDLMLAGHTHGGQITFEILNPALNPARVLTPFVRGLYTRGNSSCYVTRGIGTLGVPARLGSRPEITLLKLTCLS